MSYEYPEADFKSLRGLSLFAVTGFALVILTQSLEAIVGFAQIISPEMTIDFDDGSTASVWVIFQSLLAIGYLPVLIFTATAFLIWLNRANKNLTALRADSIDFSSGWAVGWWFIPFANLVKPFQVVREVWCESDPNVELNADRGPNFLSTSLRSAPMFMGLWWALWILSNIAANVSSRLFDPEDMSNMAISGYAFVVSGTLAVAGAALAIRIVREITNRQDARSCVINSIRSNILPPPPNFASGS